MAVAMQLKAMLDCMCEISKSELNNLPDFVKVPQEANISNYSEQLISIFIDKAPIKDYFKVFLLICALFRRREYIGDVLELLNGVGNVRGRDIKMRDRAKAGGIKRQGADAALL